jgi:PAS domain S-box-containing protein
MGSIRQNSGQEPGEVMMNSPLNRKLQAAFAIPMLALLLMGAASYRCMTVLDESNRWVRHTHEVLDNLNDLQSSMESASRSYRDFVLTGEESYLPSYHADVSIAMRDEATVRSLTVDNPRQQNQLPRLESLLAEKLRIADEVIRLRRAKGFEVAAEAVRSGTGLQTMDKLQATLIEMKGEELRLLAVRLADAKRRALQTKSILVIGMLLALVVTAGAGWSVRRESTARDLAQEAQRKGEDRFRNLANNISQLAWMADDKFSRFWYNERWFEYCGTTPEELAGLGWQKLLHPDHLDRVVEELNRCFQSGEIWEDTFPLRGKDGTYRMFLARAVPIRDAKGMVLRWVGTNTDITELLNSEKHVAQMEERYRGLLEAAPDAMVVVNQSGEIVLLNLQAERQFAYHRDELIGKKVTNIIPAGFAERLIADGSRTTAEALAQQIGTGIELNGLRKDGTRFPIEIMLSPLESPEGVLVTAAIRDISERKQIARQLQQSQKMEAVGQLTGGIAHDFNNLLAVIIGNLGLLDRLVSDNEAAVKRVRTAEKAALRGADITRRLLVFSSNEELKPAFVLLEDSVQNMIEMASRGLGSDIKITTGFDRSIPLLFVDPAALESALLNLVVNARDAMPNGGSIFICSVRKDLDDSHPAVRAGDLKKGSYAWVKVTDTGQGMSRETIERACEPFFTTKPPDKGTGLGLAMVYGFVKQCGGIVRIYSELDVGTTVSFYLPIVEGTSHPVSTNIPKYSGAELSGTVLVVDDEEDILEVAIVYLKEMGFTVFSAKSGTSALDTIVQHGEIDLMITDIVMADGMNGADLVRKARVLCPDLKVIYSSGFPAEALVEKSMNLIDGPLLRKPYQRLEFAAIVHHEMESSSNKPVELECSNSG